MLMSCTNITVNLHYMYINIDTDICMRVPVKRLAKTFLEAVGVD